MYTLAVDHEVEIDGTLICSYGTVACPYSNLHVLLFLHVQILFFMSMGEQSLVKTLTQFKVNLLYSHIGDRSWDFRKSVFKGVRCPYLKIATNKDNHFRRSL
jgi:hypothetical protein